ALPSRVRAGDRYRFSARFQPPPDENTLLRASLDPGYQRVQTEVPTGFVSRGARWASDQKTPVGEMVGIAKALRTEGAYTDGGEEANPVSPPGHSVRRLLDFIETSQPFGNGEQFAAAQGLLALSRSVPVRVVMGFENTSGDE